MTVCYNYTNLMIPEDMSVVAVVIFRRLTAELTNEPS